MTIIAPQTIDEVQAAVRAHTSAPAPWAVLRPAGAGTKTALAPDADSVRLDLTGLDGIVDYQPQECTFTARAGTRIDTIARAIGEHGLYLPFDPPFAASGATIGGTVATALSGPARYRYGGVRDFLLGVRFVDGEGRLVRGGGRVVKNAAGFYLHHLLLGSIGRLGAIVDVTCKVFPSPAAYATVRVDYANFDRLLASLVRLRCSTFEIEAIELEPPSRALVRLGGVRAALEARVEALVQFFQKEATAVGVVEPDDEPRVWREARELTWAQASDPEAAIVKVATSPGMLSRLEPKLAQAAVTRRYGMGGEIAWLVWTRPLDELDRMLTGFRLSGLTIGGPTRPDPYIGVRPDETFLARVRQTLDPRGVFGGGKGG